MFSAILPEHLVISIRHHHTPTACVFRWVARTEPRLQLGIRKAKTPEQTRQPIAANKLIKPVVSAIIAQHQHSDKRALNHFKFGQFIRLRGAIGWIEHFQPRSSRQTQLRQPQQRENRDRQLDRARWRCPFGTLSIAFKSPVLT